MRELEGKQMGKVRNKELRSLTSRCTTGVNWKLNVKMLGKER